MTWRHFLLLATCAAMFIINGVLLFFEDVNLDSSEDGPVDRITDPLLSTVWRPDQRIANFKAFGMPDDMATVTARRTAEIYNDNERLTLLINQDPALLSTVLCPHSGVPERYLAMHLLVDQDDLGSGIFERDVISYNRVNALPLQDWASSSRLGEVYNAVEMTERRRSDSTVMGVGAVMSVREDDLFQRNAPFGTINWRFAGLRSAEPDIDAKLIEYFALLHVLVELATNPETGICR